MVLNYIKGDVQYLGSTVKVHYDIILAIARRSILLLLPLPFSGFFVTSKSVPATHEEDAAVLIGQAWPRV